MKILFLDDSKERTKYFISRVPSAINGFSAQEIINKILKEKEVDILFLDHDLEGTFQPSHSKNCGMEVVRYIIKHKLNIKNIIVHSLNYPAAQEMISKLKDANYDTIYCSFLHLMSENTLEKIINSKNKNGINS